MDYSAMLGGSYESQAFIADCEDTWNWYVEQLQSPNATRKLALYPTPGVEVVTQVTSGQGRAHFAMAGREFSVNGDHLWEIDIRGVATDRGAVGIDQNPATISSNGDYASQLFITSAGDGYIFNLDTNVLTKITALNGLATMGAYLEGYFLCLDASTSTVYISDLADGTTWETGLQKFQRQAQPDPWLSLKVVGRFIWLFGERTSELWFNAGNLVPFEPYPGVPIIHYGIKAPFSPAILGTDVIWLAVNATGKICVCLGQQMQANVISTYPIETALYNYTEPEKAIGDAYSDRGHTFYLLGFDTDHVTWCFDFETKIWHKRGTWVPDEGRFDSWRPRFYAYSFGEHRMLDVQDRNIFRMSADFATDADGSFIRRVRRAPAIANGNERIFYSSLELLMEPGVGIQEPADPPNACFHWQDEST